MFRISKAQQRMDARGKWMGLRRPPLSRFKNLGENWTQKTLGRLIIDPGGLQKATNLVLLSIERKKTYV